MIKDIILLKYYSIINCLDILFGFEPTNEKWESCQFGKMETCSKRGALIWRHHNRQLFGGYHTTLTEQRAGCTSAVALLLKCAFENFGIYIQWIPTPLRGENPIVRPVGDSWLLKSGRFREGKKMIKNKI